MSVKRLTYKETFLKATAQEVELAAKKIASLHKAKASCANCKFSLHKSPLILWCACKDKRINNYNICIEHKKV